MSRVDPGHGRRGHGTGGWRRTVWGATGARAASFCARGIRQNRGVAYIRLIDVDEATGELREQYDAAIERAGKVFNIVKAMSLRPRVLEAAIGLYGEVMFGESELSRAERELLAVVVSAENTCHY
jgi:alkylhydroperoxidase family enzyme